MPTPTATQAATRGEALTIGYSRQGRPLLAFRVGRGRRSALVLGGIHAGTEANAAQLVQQLLDQAEATPEALPPDLTLVVVPVVNPDGFANGTRELASGVDANRNWPTDDWTGDTYEAGPRGPLVLPGGGGTAPLSEPETLALAQFVLRLRPGALISYHSAASLIMGGPTAHALGLDVIYAASTGYRVGDWTSYPVTGDLAQWAEDQGIPTVEVELPDHQSTDFEANWSALLDLLWSAFA
jgi:zinc carboxypeptidase